MVSCIVDAVVTPPLCTFGNMDCILLRNIGLLAGIQDPSTPLRQDRLQEFPTLSNAFLLIKDGLINEWGCMNDLADLTIPGQTTQIDAREGTIMPTWCDSHTHIVFAASREDEFVDKIKGLSYAEIAARGGGILNSACMLQTCSEDALFDSAWQRLNMLMKMGTGLIEIKSGYGLTLEAELKMLRVIRRLKESAPITIKSTFLGAHTYPERYRDHHRGYLDMLINEWIPEVGKQQLADYIDVFCEKNFFSVDEMKEIVSAGAKHGLIPKLHVNQLSSMGGVQAGIAAGALSLDHLEVMREEDIKSLAASSTIGTLLPTAAYFLRMPFQPARAMIDAGAAIALASDFNPGSSPGGNMHTVVSMSCIQMRMLPEEALNAATINGAFALQEEKREGSIAKGKHANLLFLPKVKSLAYIPYAFSSPLIERVMIKGRFL